MKKTKIICTLGPACGSEPMLRSLIEGGMNAARFNFSHGNHDSHLEQLQRLRSVAAELDAPIAAILDTKGPEIRIRSVAEGASLSSGSEFTLTTREIDGDNTIASVTYASLHEELSSGCRILIDDGLIELRVLRIVAQDIVCSVINGGPLSSNKSINIPDVHINLPSLTERDRADISFAIENDFDYIAASFVRRASDVLDIRELLESAGGGGIGIIAKIENGEGVRNMSEIIDAADAVMVARGDLGVEIPAHEVPVIQKQLVSKCTEAGKPVIIATQLLDSMIRNPRPTRAEISDVANAVFESASCVMLSGETASGKYPVESLRAMSDTLLSAERVMQYGKKTRFVPSGVISDAISHSCCLTATDLGAQAILAATASGHTAKVISRYKPGCEIIALTTTERVRRQLSLFWGVRSYLTPPATSTDELFDMCLETAVKHGDVKSGDIVIITAGVPVGRSGTTNLIKAQVVE